MKDKEISPLAISRRSLLTTAGRAVAGGVALSVGSPFILSARGEVPTKIGLVFAKQGTWTEQGELLVNGANIALEQAKGQVLGRPVQLVWYDEPSPQAAQQNLQKLAEEEKVIAALGGTNSGTALAMSAVAKRVKIPFITPNAAAREITGKECNPYTFRVLTTTSVASRAMGPYLASLGKKWYFICASYAYGQDVYTEMKKQLEEAGGTEVGSDKTPLGTADFSSFLLKIRQAKPDVIIAGLPGGDLSAFLKQFSDMGLKGKIPVACPIIGDSDLWSIGQDAATGIYGKPWHFSDPNNTAADKSFIDAYQAKYKKPPADKAWLGWFSMRSLLLGIEQAKATDAAAIVRGLETARFEDGAIPAYYREWDHQMLRRSLVLKVKDKISDKWDWLDVLKVTPERAADLEPQFGTKDEVGCRMEAL
ncbi:ABC transporter substrate-binding protein [Azospirillum endophyticum]